MPWASHQATGRTNHSGALKAKVIPPPSLQKVIILPKAINRNKPTHPMAYCPPGRGLVVCHIYRGHCPRLLIVVPSRHQSACGSCSTADYADRTDSCPVAIEEIKKFVAFPRLTPLQPDAYAHPCKRASLADPPHPSGLPIGRRKPTKQNSCRWQYKMSLFRGY